jgi:hypothetical protein
MREMTKKRSIYRQSEGNNPIDLAVKQYAAMEDAFEAFTGANYKHIEEARKLQAIIDSLDDAQYEEYMRRTQP